MRARSTTRVRGRQTRRRSLVASCFMLILSTVGVLGFLGSADAATTNQILPPNPSLCPKGTTPLTGIYKGLCKTVDGVVFNPITKKILYSPKPSVPSVPSIPSLPGTQPPPRTPRNPGAATAPPQAVARSNPGGRTYLISSSVVSSHSYGTPYGVYFGNFGGGKTFFAPKGQYETYRRVIYLSAFGRPVSSDVSTTVIDATSVAPVSTSVPHAPDEVWLLLPFGLVLLTVVTYLVLEPDSDRVLA